jgi:hypothetical protein
MAQTTDGNGETDSLGRHPWRRDRYIIRRVRQTAPTATVEQLRAAVAAACDHTEALIDAAQRQDWAEWQFQRAEGASRITETIGRQLGA